MITKMLTMRRIPLLLLASAFAYAAPAGAQTLLLHYNFDEASSGNAPANDLGSGTPAPGAFVGSATRTSNTPGNFSTGALNLTASASASLGYVTAGDADKLDGLSHFTLSTWLNLQGTNTSGNFRLLAKQSGGTFDSFSWNISAPVSGTRSASNFGLRLFVGGQTAFTFDAATAPFSVNADNKWIFLAVTYDGTSTSNNVSYFSGSAADNVSLLGTTTVNAGAVKATTAAFNVGHTDAALTSNTAPPGFMDDTRVYSGHLSLSQLNDVRVAAIPEPSAAVMLGLGSMLLALRRRR